MRDLLQQIRRGLSFIVALCMLLNLVGCSGVQQEQEDILTQKKTDPNKTQITVLVKYAFPIHIFEKALEEKFPDIDIVQVGNFTGDLGIREYEKRLEHDDLTDIVMTWPLDVGKEYWEDRLIDLSGMPFTSQYSVSMLGSIVEDDKLFYLPGPGQIRGIVYNKTLFEEQGWDIPTNFEEFVSLCKTIEESGIRAIQLGFKNPEVLDTAFVGYNFAEHFSTPQDIQWIKEFNQGKHSFGDHFSTALDVFQTMIDAGIWQPEDLNRNYSDREMMLFQRQCAMVEDSVLLARMGERLTGSKDEFALMPFFNPGSDSDWARLYMVCFIGLNKHLQEAGNEEKYQKVLKIMDYISSVEGQNALMGDTGGMFSSVIGTSPPDVPEIQDLTNALTKGRYAAFPELEHAQSALRTGLAGMIAGTMTKEEVIAMVDEQNRNPLQGEPSTLLGEATQDFTLMETGSFVADALRESAGTDIGLYLDNGKDGRYNGKGISGKFYQGQITLQDVKRVLADLKAGEKGELCTVTVRGEDLIQILEYAIPVENNETGWFYYFSGLRMEYDVTAPPGQRIQKIETHEGKPIDPEAEYSVATVDHSLPQEFFISHLHNSDTIEQLLTQYIQQKGKISPSLDGRFQLGQK